MRAGVTNKSSLLVRSFRRTQKQQTTTRPYLPSHLQNLTSPLPSGPMASDPALIRRLRSSLRLLYTGELWNVPSVFLCVWFLTFNAHKTHELSFLLISFRRYHFQLLSRWLIRNPLRDHTVPVSPNCATLVYRMLWLGLVLPPEHQLLKVLRPSDMHGMLCANQAIRTYYHTFSFRTCGLSLLRAGAFRSCLYLPSLENRDWQRWFGRPSSHSVTLRGHWKP